MEAWVIEGLTELVGRSDREVLPRLLPGCLARDEWDGTTYYRCTRNAEALGRGLVITREGVVPDYPRIRRVFHLTNAITKYYYSPFYLEEQAPGVFVRLARVNGRVLAFRRDGRCCPFATDRAGDLLPGGLLDERPDLIVGMTVSGRETPYPPDPWAREELQTAVVELAEWNVREPVTTAERYEIVEEYGLPTVRRAGPFTADDSADVARWLAGVDGTRARGVVLKPSERHHRPLKCATPSALLQRRDAWLGLEGEGGVEPGWNDRVLRAACAAVELDRSPDAWDWEAVGRALLEPVARALHAVDEGQALRDERSAWFHGREAAEDLVSYLAASDASLSVEEISLEPEDGGWRLRFAVEWSEATAELRRRLSGASY